MAVCSPNLRLADKCCGLENFIFRNRKMLEIKLIIFLGSFIEVSLTEREFFVNQKTLHRKNITFQLVRGSNYSDFLMNQTLKVLSTAASHVGNFLRSCLDLCAVWISQKSGLRLRSIGCGLKSPTPAYYNTNLHCCFYWILLRTIMIQRREFRTRN